MTKKEEEYLRSYIEFGCEYIPTAQVIKLLAAFDAIRFKLNKKEKKV